jgi:iron(III) transport system permease protein
VAAVLVAVDALKELPIVLLLRPIGFDTLAVHVWQLAADSRYEMAGLPALAIVLVAAVPVAMLFRRELLDPPTPVPAHGETEDVVDDELRLALAGSRS